MRANSVIPSEATHSSLNLLLKPPLLVTFDQAFEQKSGHLYSPSGSSVEFKLSETKKSSSKICLEVKCRSIQSKGNNLRYTDGDANASDTPYFVNITLCSLFADFTLSEQCHKQN